jgi:hypothetical protein
MKEIFLISEQTLKSRTILNNNVDNSYIAPAIRVAQDMGLQPLIGSKLFNKLKDLVATGDIAKDENSDYKKLLDEYITPFLENKVVADVQLSLVFKLRNQGVVSLTGENVYNPSLRDIQYLIQNYENKANFYGSRLSDYLKANNSKYPEYLKIDSCADMPSNKGAYNTGIFLG